MTGFENGKINYGMVALIAVAAAVISSLVTYKAMAGKAANFAVVDVQRVVMASKDLVALNSERNAQIQNLRKMADEANEQINKEKKEDAKKKLSEKFLAEINAKKAAYDKDYASALQASDQKLNGIINSVAEKEGLKVVFNKSSLVTGGVDITAAVIEQVR
jgi:outer membrane protein